MLLVLAQAAKGPGDDVRAVGSDIKAGEVVLPKGSVIGAAEVGLLATVGASKLKVRPSVSRGTAAVCRTNFRQLHLQFCQKPSC